MDRYTTNAMRRPTKSALHPEDKGFGQRLRRLRQDRAWTQAELSTKAQVERSVIANYELGHSFPPVPVLRRLALALGASVDQLIFETTEPSLTVQDRGLLEIFSKVDRLDYRAKDIVKELIEGVLAKRELNQQQRKRKHA